MTDHDGLPPGPRLGRLHQTIGWWYRPLPWIEQCRQRYGNRFTLRLIGVPPIVVIADPDEIRQVLTADPDLLLPGVGTRLLEPITGPRSIGLMDGEEHLTERKLLMPALHGERLAAMTATMEAKAEAAITGWPATESIALHPLLITLSLDIIVAAIARADEADPRLDQLREAYADLFAWNARLPNLVPWMRRSVAGRGPWAYLLAARARADALLYELIAERRAAPAGDTGADILGFLLAARYPDGSTMSDQQIRDELTTLVAGGHQTLALALTWAADQLARTPSVLRQLVAEIDAGDDDAYLTATVHETLRHRPVIPIGPRHVAHPAMIGDWTYPPGVLLQAEAYLLHHDPAVYDDPYAFRPERFLDHPPDTYSWIPFGGGRRRCIGLAFAMLELKIVLRALLRARDLRPAGPPVAARRHSIGLVPEDGGRLLLPLRRQNRRLTATASSTG